jgi:hypothetical protein
VISNSVIPIRSESDYGGDRSLRHSLEWGYSRYLFLNDGTQSVYTACTQADQVARFGPYKPDSTSDEVGVFEHVRSNALNWLAKEINLAMGQELALAQSVISRAISGDAKIPSVEW